MEPARTPLPERNLDVLRAIAVLCVFACHASMAARGPLGEWFGRAGVLLFFVHTSLVLMGSLERTGTDPGWVGRFYVRRAARIYPLAIVVIIGVVLIGIDAYIPVWHGPAVPAHPLTPFAIGANLALAQNLLGQTPVLTVLWTLPVEVQMYVVLPLCFLIARRSLPWTIVALGLGAIVAIVWGLIQAHVPGAWRFTTAPYIPCFLSGVVSYAILYRRPPRSISSVWWVPAIALSIALCWATFAWWPSNGWLTCLVLGVTIPFVRELPASILTQAGAIVAKYSYAIYLLHIPALRAAYALAPRGTNWQLVGLTILLTGAGSWLCYHVVEAPAVQWARGQTIRIRPALIPRESHA